MTAAPRFADRFCRRRSLETVQNGAQTVQYPRCFLQPAEVSHQKTDPVPGFSVQNLFRPLKTGISLVALLVSVATLSAAESGLVAERPASGRFVKTDRGYMIPYKTRIPGSRVEFEMQPIPGGVFQLGSPAGENGRHTDEGPQAKIVVPPFWIGTHEVTWGEYKRYMAMQGLLRELRRENRGPLQPVHKVDVFTAPSALYDPVHVFQFGEEADRPAITMKQYAAKQYTKWLSGMVGTFYRLPTEAEWEYTCRAGTTTAYSFGDDPTKLGDHGWFANNSDEKTQRVGLKLPNPWGLHDMHGNVAEWTLDEFFADQYATLAQEKQTPAADAVLWPKKLFPRVVRGGSWDDEAAACRSAARLGSNDVAWSAEDAFLPTSPWWFTNGYAFGVGFRIVRPFEPPPPEQREPFWSAGLKSLERDVNEYIENNGRGERGAANDELRKTIEKRTPPP